MIQLPEVTVSKDIEETLTSYQKEIDDLPTFEEKVAKAKTSFKSQNRKGNKTFDEIKDCLTAMCSGARRCVYCEDSFADEVEHIRPKHFFPEKCFVWTNYVYACGSCNGPKSSNFAIFRDDDGSFYELTSRKESEDDESENEPPKGEDVIINPRIENPMDYCFLDIRNSFKFFIIPTLNPKQRQKADYTFNQLLRLNGIRKEDEQLAEEEKRKLKDRELLRNARKEAYGDYKARLQEYNSEKKGSKNQNKLNNMIMGIKQKQHPTVWKEMQRYFHKNWLKDFDGDLHNLFEESPEALNW